MSLCVVVPVYNVEKYLRICIDSLINQSRKIDKIILVDDGSSDNSPLICDDYAKKYNNILTIHQKNAGLGMARNTGIDHCTTEYISFFDPDDFADRDYIENLMKPIDEEFDTSKSSYRKVNKQGSVLGENSTIPGTFYGESVRRDFLPRLIGNDLNKKDSIPMSSCGTIYSMHIILEHNIRFVSERVWISEDIVFNIEYFSHAQRVKLINYIGYNYRYNPNSLTTTYKADRFEKCKAIYLKEKKMLSDIGIYKECRYRLDIQFFIYIRSCISQLRVSNLSTTDSIKEIGKICNDKFVQTIVRGFPKMQMGPKQNIFLVLIAFKQAHILYYLLCREFR